MLYRAQSVKRLNFITGQFDNPNIDRVRAPRDMPLWAHQAIGKWFLEKFDLNYREKSIFCTGNIDIARGYVTERSRLIRVEPIGDYSICHSDGCRDLFGHLQFGLIREIFTEENIRIELEKLNYKEFKNAIPNDVVLSGNEVMVFAKAFSFAVLPVFVK